jgi:putative membrane protein
MTWTALYAKSTAHLQDRANEKHRVNRRHAAAHVLAVVTVAVALLSPLDRWSDARFSAHMSQHELLMLVAAPLAVLSRPLHVGLWALPASWMGGVTSALGRRGVKAAWRAVSAPLVLLLLHGLVRWVWHAPALFEAALASEPLHALQHLTFFGSAALFWWAIVNGRYGRAGYGVAVLFVFATSAHSGALAALITLAGQAWYPTHAARTLAEGGDPLADQQLAGLLMWVPAAVLLLVVALALFAAWLGEAARRAERASHARLRSAGAGATEVSHQR